MARETAHIVLEANGKTATLKVVRGTVSNLARIDLIARPWGGTTAMTRENAHTPSSRQQFEGVLKVVRSGEDGSASALGRGDSAAGASARTTGKTNKELS
jgi:hypothetical protein